MSSCKHMGPNSKMNLGASPGLLVAVCLALGGAQLRGSLQRTIFLTPGTQAEKAAVAEDTGSALEKGARTAAAGGGWTYRLVVPPGALCTLAFDGKGPVAASVATPDGKAVPGRAEAAGEKYSVSCEAAPGGTIGGELRFRLAAGDGPIAVRDVVLSVCAPDRTGDGLGDAVESMMGLAPGARAAVAPRPATPHTGFFFSQPYDEAMAVPTDAVQLYNGSSPADLKVYSTWAAKGYRTQVFLHSRYGRELRDMDDENQTDRNGRPLGVIVVSLGGKPVDLAVGPLTPEYRAAMVKRHGEGITIDMVDKYKLPTKERIELARSVYAGALAAGVGGFCFDEPEIWADAGYSGAFRREWAARYGTAWQPPHESVDARYKSERLKAFLIRRWVESILEDVRRAKPDTTRMLAMHSPINYYQIRMATPHQSLASIPALQEVVAEVWNDPFETSYLEYSSFWNLVRGTGRRLWFMMDPWGDSPAMSLDFYRRSYGENLLAALMFPQIDAYQPLIWPNRLYGQVPRDYEVLMNTVTGALGQMWRYQDGRVEEGGRGIGTFVSDSMGWQRADPAPSDFDGFYGLSTTLVTRGVPLEVLSLDRAAEPGYLDAVRCLLVSYDFLKPAEAPMNRALADWVRRGGSLVLFGGTDAYNGVSESWWRRAGYASPLEELFARMGLPVRGPTVLSEPGTEAVLEACGPALRGFPGSLRVPVGPSPGEEEYLRQVSFGQVEEASRDLRRSYPLTLYAPPPGGSALYRLAGQPAPVAWEAAVGKGRVVFVGVAPGYLKDSGQGPAWMRALARHALEEAGGTYREQPWFVMRRGPYTAVRALGEPYPSRGRFVDLLSPTLEVVENPVVPAHECAFMEDAGEVGGPPRLLAASGRLTASYDGADVTSFVAEAPARTPGAARVWAGGRRAREVRAFTVMGAPVAVTSRAEGPSLLLQYDNQADGAVVRVEWEP